MFVSLTSRNLEEKYELHGVMLYYSNPSIVTLEREAWPDGARLRFDLKNCAYFGSGIEVFVICCKGVVQAPLMLQGFLMPDENASCPYFATLDGAFDISTERFIKANMTLLKKAAIPAFPTELPVLSSEGVAVEWKPMKHFSQNLDGKIFVLGWIGGLTLLHAQSTAAAFRFLKKPRDELRLVLEQQFHGEPSGSPLAPVEKKSIFWLWWPSSKPANLETWFDSRWKANLTREQLLQCFLEHHPMLGGFYRVLLSQTTKKSQVSIHWMCEHDTAPYDVELVTGADSPGTPVGPAVSRIRLPPQHKILPPFWEDIGTHRWEAMDDLAMLTNVLIIGKIGEGVAPTQYGPVRSKADRESIKEWTESLLGSLDPLEASISAGLMCDALENESSLMPMEVVRD